MDIDLITVKVLIHRNLFKPILINTVYKYYSLVDKNLITKLRLPRIKILPKSIISFIKENIKEPWVEITEITKFFINVTGRVACKQKMPKDEERSIKEGKGRERNLVSQGVTVIYIDEKGGSCLTR